jgi:hypothetical protein
MLRPLLLALWLLWPVSTRVPSPRISPTTAEPKAIAQALPSAAQQPGSTSSFSAQPFPHQRFAASNDREITEVQCVRLNAQWSVCKHLFPDLFFALVKDRRIVGTWPGAIIAGGGSRYEAVIADLDGDHKDELIVADCTGINTAGHVLWQLSIFPNYEERGFTKPLQFTTEQYAAAGTFLQTPGDPLCNLLITEWQMRVFEPRSEAFKAYDYIGRWYHYKDGFLEPIAGRSFRVRRWSDDWYRVPLRRQTPYDWLSHSTAKTFTEEPLTRTDIVAEVRGEIVHVLKTKNPETDAEPLDISLRLPSGATRNYHLYGDDLTDEPDQFCHLGDARTGILFPKDYEPADLKAWLVGQQVRMVDYKSPYTAVRRILWVR